MRKYRDNVSTSATSLVIFFFKIPLEVRIYVLRVKDVWSRAAERWGPAGRNHLHDRIYSLLPLLILKRRETKIEGAFEHSMNTELVTVMLLLV